MLDEGISAKLDADLDRSRVKQKQVGNRPAADYLETYDVINRANEIFGYGQWGTKVVNLETQPVDGRSVCIATLELWVNGCESRQDIGVNISAGNKPEALETAIKGAASDALKRCFRHFGKQFGNDLYSKDGPVAKAAPAPQLKHMIVPAAQRKPAPDAETLREWITTRAENKKQASKPTKAQLGLVNGLLGRICGDDRLQFLGFMFGKNSSKELTKGQASALIDWAKGDDTKEPHEVAYVEYQMVMAAHAKEQGQEEFAF